MKKRGTYIVIEGIDGSGKDTVIDRLRKEKLLSGALFTREPGGTPRSEELRRFILKDEMSPKADAFTQLMLFLAARADLLRHRIAPALARGMTVVSNRGDASTYAYQIYGAEGGRQLEGLFVDARKLLSEVCRVPDLYLFLDVEPRVAIRRTAERRGGTNHFDREKASFFALVREGYLAFLWDKPHVRIDANRPIDDVWKDVLREARDRVS